MGLLNRRRSVVHGKSFVHSTKQNSVTVATKHNDETIARSNRRRQWNTIVSSLRRTHKGPQQPPPPDMNDEASIINDIWTACKTGDAVSVRQIISENPGLLHEELQGRTPLYCACHGGHYKVAELLLQAGATDDALKTCYQSALNQKIRQLLQQYQAVDMVMGKKVTNSNIDCVTPACSSSSSSSGCFDEQNDMYLHLFDTIESTCSNSDDINDREMPPPTTNVDDPAIDCSDSLLTERVNNHSVPISKIRSATTTTAINTTNQLVPSFLCCRAGSLIDSDAMEDGMWNDEADSNIDTDDTEKASPQSQPDTPVMMSTLTIETSDRRIEVQETLCPAVPSSLTAPSTTSPTIQSRFFKRVALRRPDNGVRTRGKKLETETRPRTIFSGRRTKVDTNDCDINDETIETASNGESEVVLYRNDKCSQQCFLDSERTEGKDDKDNSNVEHNQGSQMRANPENPNEELISNIDTLKVSDSDLDGTSRNIFGVATPVERLLAQSVCLTPRPSTISTSSSLKSFDTFASSDDIKKFLIPIATVPVPLDNADDLENAVIDREESPKGSEVLDNRLTISPLVKRADGTSTSFSGRWNEYFSRSKSSIRSQDILLIHEWKVVQDISDTDLNHDGGAIPKTLKMESISDRDQSIASCSEFSASVNGVQERNGSDFAPTHRTFLESTMDVFGCVPDEADDTFTLQSMSFDNHRDLATLSRTTPPPLSLNGQLSVSEQTLSNVDGNLTSRVDKLIHETSTFQTTKLSIKESSINSTSHEVPELLAAPLPITSTSVPSDTDLNKNSVIYQCAHSYPEIDDDANHLSYTSGTDTTSDDDNDVTSSSQNTENLPEEKEMDWRSTSSGSESFFDDDDEYDDNTFNQRRVDDDEISGPEVTSIFCT